MLITDDMKQIESGCDSYNMSRRRQKSYRNNSDKYNDRGKPKG